MRTNPGGNTCKRNLRKNRSRLVLQRRREALYEVEQALSARLDMSAVLNVVRRPITFRCRIVTLIEQRVERLEDEHFVLFVNRLIHFYPPSRTGAPRT